MVVEWVQSGEAESASEEVRKRALYTWARHEPKTAAKFLLNHQDWIEDDGVAANFAGYFVLNDPEATVHWANQLERHDCKTAPFKNAIRAWSKTAPDKVLEYGGTVDDESEQLHIYRSLISTLMNEDPEAARDMLDRIPDSHRVQATQSGISQLAHISPMEAVEEIKRRPEAFAGSESAVATKIMTSIAEAWARSDPQSTLDWAMKLEDLSQKTAAVSAAIEQWTRVDALGASSYVNGVALLA